MVKILNETQEQRDNELSSIMNESLDSVKSKKIAGSSSICIFNGTKEPITEEEYISLYEKFLNLDTVAYLKTLMYTSIHRRCKELIELLKATKGKRCLDFGSGVGTHTIAMLENGNKVDLLDVNGPLLEFAKKRIWNRKLDFGLEFTDSCELPEDFYDVVICTDVLEHCYDPIREMKRIHASMKVGGVVLLMVSNMVKPSSGHFKKSIDKWVKGRNDMLRKFFKKEKMNVYRKVK